MFLTCAISSSYADLLVAQSEHDYILNRLVSSISGIMTTSTDAKIIDKIEGTGLEQLTTLNTMCQSDLMFWARVQESRIVMLVNSVLPWPTQVSGSASLWIVGTEILRLMKSVLPFIQHLNADFWNPLMLNLRESLQVSHSFG